MRTIVRYFLFALMCAVIVAPAGARNRRFSDEELLKGTYGNVVGKTPVPIRFSGDTLFYSCGGDIFGYDCDGGFVTKLTSKMKTRYSSPMPKLVEGWVNPTYSPDSTHIAYTLDNDLYSIDVATKEVVRHTFDGSEVILNGYASWVYYEEIFGRPSHYKAFWWSPDGKVLAFYRFDNTDVPMFPIYNSEGQHGTINRTRYPKAGDRNPVVRVGFVSVFGGETVWADFDSSKDQYFGTPFWSGDGKHLMVSWMSRSQDDFELYSVTPFTGQIHSVYKEHQKSWIDWMDGMLFTTDGMFIVRDFTGWQQIYFLSYDGRKFEQLTCGKNWGITLLKADRRYVYFTVKRGSTISYDIYRVGVNGKNMEMVSIPGYSYRDVVISENGRNIAAIASNAHTPCRLVNISLPVIKPIERRKMTTVCDSKGPDFDKYDIAFPSFVTIRTRDGYKIPASVIWPLDMDKTKKYPVIAYIYGGPDNPQVSDSWNCMKRQWWANHGVIQVILDNRAGGHLGKAGIEQVYRHLADKEIDDFIDGIKYFLDLPFVDKDKIGVTGFSFGGTMTALCVTQGCDFFKYGIAGGGVYDWSLYDTHYTERYMDTPQDNPQGYSSTRVMERVTSSAYKGDRTNMLRITHGTGDDNVHFQNTLQLVDAMQKACMDFELMIYPQGMHGYRGAQGQHSNMQDYKFWYRYLLESDLPESVVSFYRPQ